MNIFIVPTLVLICIIWRAVNPKSFKKFAWGCLVPFFITDVIFLINMNSISDWMNKKLDASSRTNMEKISAKYEAMERAEREFVVEKNHINSMMDEISTKLKVARADLWTANSTELKILAIQRLSEQLHSSLELSRRSIRIAEERKKYGIDIEAERYMIKKMIAESKRAEKDTVAEIKQLEKNLKELQNQWTQGTSMKSKSEILQVTPIFLSNLM